MKPRILVTGATGFLGKNLLERLRQDSEVTVFAQRFDLTKEQKVFSYITLSKPDMVFHLGALVDLTRSFDVARKTIEANIIGTTNLLLALAANPAKRLIFASTEEVYGEGTLPYRETDVPNPPSPYAATKVTGEHLVRLYRGRAAATSLVLRIGTMYGPHQPDRRLIHQIIQKAINHEDIPLTWGTKKRDYVYVGDVVEALLRAKDAKNLPAFDVINVGGQTMVSLKALADMIVAAASSSSRLRLGAIPDRIGESDEWLLDNTKAGRVLGWSPKTDIQTGMKETIVWIRKKNYETK